MKLTLISRNYGTQTIDTETFRPYRAGDESTIFLIVEHIFETWMETAPQSAIEPYQHDYDQPAIYSIAGAITHGIELLIESAEMLAASRKVEALTLTTREIQNMDIECAFE